MYHPAIPETSLPFDPSNDERGIDLGGLILFLKRRWKLIFVAAAAVAALISFVVLQQTPLYTASASVAVQTQKTQVVDIQDVLSGLAPDQATMETQASIMRSRRLAGQLVDKLKLDQDSEFNPAAQDGRRRTSLFSPSTWFGSGPIGKPAAQLTAEQRDGIITNVMSRMSITPAARSYVITIDATSDRPAMAQRLADAMADIYITDGIAQKYEATRKASNYLQNRVDELRAQTVATDRAAEGYRSAAGLVGSDQGATVASQQMSELSSQLITARAERAAKEAQLGQLRRLSQGGGDGGVESSSAVLASPLIQNLRQQESEVVRKLGELRATYGERHPKIINAEAELRDLRGKIGDEIGKAAASASNDVAISRARESTLASSLSHVEGAVSAGGAASVRLRELQRESDANRQIYEDFLTRQKQVDQQANLQTPDARLVSNASVPTAPSFPQLRPTLMVGAAIGLLFGLMLAFAVEKLDNTIRSAQLLESMGGGATLAFVPTVKNGMFGKAEDVVIDKPQTMVPEALRTLRSAIALSDVDQPPKVVMLSSSVPAEGKTFTSVGLARVSAQSGIRTILIDADMRHPRVHKALDLHNDMGLVQVLSGQCALEDALQYDAGTDLHVLTAGKGAVNPPDMLRSETMANLMAHLRRTYGFVVIDSPPFAPLTDSQVLTRMVDKMLLVVRWGETPLPVVQNTIKQIQRVHAPLVGSVLSQVNIARHAKYGYGDYGYHYSKYGAYYGTST